ncbi:MAG: tetratricopeptide repeat protein, partial [Candidatus Rokuibacteriota bacterium]
MRRVRRVASTLLLIAIVAAGCSDAKAQKQRHLDGGDRYMGRGAYRPAIVEFRHALVFESTDRRVLRRIGLAQHRLGQHRAALESLLLVAESAENDLALRLEIGRVQLALGRLGEAWNQARFVLDRDPSDLEALALVAAAATTASQIEAARGSFAGAAPAVRERAAYHVALGNLYLRQRETSRAERAFTEAIGKDSGSVEAHVALARLYIGMGQRARAEQVLHVAGRIEPAPPAARLTVADACMLLARPDEAARILREISERTPDYLPAWHGLAEVLFSARRYDESVAALREILAVDASDPHARLLRGRIHMARGETEAATREFEEVVRSEPELPTPRYFLATAHIQAGQLGLAKRELAQAVSIAPGFDQATVLLADLY